MVPPHDHDSLQTAPGLEALFEEFAALDGEKKLETAIGSANDAVHSSLDELFQLDNEKTVEETIQKLREELKSFNAVVAVTPEVIKEDHTVKKQIESTIGAVMERIERLGIHLAKLQTLSPDESTVLEASREFWGEHILKQDDAEKRTQAKMFLEEKKICVPEADAVDAFVKVLEKYPEAELAQSSDPDAAKREFRSRCRAFLAVKKNAEEPTEQTDAPVAPDVFAAWDSMDKTLRLQKIEEFFAAIRLVWTDETKANATEFLQKSGFLKRFTQNAGLMPKLERRLQDAFAAFVNTTADKDELILTLAYMLDRLVVQGKENKVANLPKNDFEAEMLRRHKLIEGDREQNLLAEANKRYATAGIPTPTFDQLVAEIARLRALLYSKPDAPEFTDAGGKRIVKTPTKVDSASPKLDCPGLNAASDMIIMETPDPSIVDPVQRRSKIRVLLGRRKNGGQLAVIGGFRDIGRDANGLWKKIEKPLDAAVREAGEEALNGGMEQQQNDAKEMLAGRAVMVHDAVVEDPRTSVDRHMRSTAYLCALTQSEVAQLEPALGHGDDIVALEWFTLEQIDAMDDKDLFGNHRMLINNAATELLYIVDSLKPKVPTWQDALREPLPERINRLPSVTIQDAFRSALVWEDGIPHDQQTPTVDEHAFMEALDLTYHPDFCWGLNVVLAKVAGEYAAEKLFLDFPWAGFIRAALRFYVRDLDNQNVRAGMEVKIGDACRGHKKMLSCLPADPDAATAEYLEMCGVCERTAVDPHMLTAFRDACTARGQWMFERRKRGATPVSIGLAQKNYEKKAGAFAALLPQGNGAIDGAA